MSVQYNVSSLLKEPVGSTREHEVDGRVLIDEGDLRHQRFRGHATFLRTNDGVLVTASLEGIRQDQCSRCLRQIELALRVEIEEEFFASADPETGAALPMPADSDAFRIDVHHTLDMEEAIRQYWTAAGPMQPLCDPDCRGLCSRCGRDLNEGDCACPPDEDERWSALRQLVGEEKRS